MPRVCADRLWSRGLARHRRRCELRRPHRVRTVHDVGADAANVPNRVGQLDSLEFCRAAYGLDASALEVEAQAGSVLVEGVGELRGQRGGIVPDARVRPDDCELLGGALSHGCCQLERGPLPLRLPCGLTIEIVAHGDDCQTWHVERQSIHQLLVGRCMGVRRIQELGAG